MSHARADHRTSYLLAALSVAVLLAASVLGGCNSHDPTGPEIDDTAPMVISKTPAPGSTGVAPGTTVTATFSEVMIAATLTTSAFTLSGPGGTMVNGSVGYDVSTTTATFTPASALAGGTTYTATVTTGAKDLAGRSLDPVAMWSFTTAVVADSIAPTVLSTVPANGATGVAINTTISAAFSEAMNAATLTGTTGRAVILSGGAQANNVYWQVGSSATLGVNSVFKGTIMADQSITLNTGATLTGRAVTRIGAVTLASNDITIP